MKEKRKHTNAIDFNDSDKEMAEEVSRYRETAGGLNQPLALIKNSIELADKTHGPVLNAVTSVASFLPPIKLILTTVLGIWDIIHAIFLDKESDSLTRGAKVGLALTIIGLSIAAFAAPPVAGVIVVAGAAVALGREMLDVATPIVDLVAAKHKLAKTQNPLKRQILEHEIKAKRQQVIQKSFDLGFAVLCVVGFALLLTPAAPVGAGVLVATAAMGIAVKLGPPVMRTLYHSVAPLAAKLKVRFFSTNTEKDSRQLSEAEQPKKVVTIDTTLTVLKKTNTEAELGTERASHLKSKSTPNQVGTSQGRVSETSIKDQILPGAEEKPEEEDKEGEGEGYSPSSHH